MVLIGCISRSQGKKIGIQIAIFKNIYVWNYKAQIFHIQYLVDNISGPLHLDPWPFSQVSDLGPFRPSCLLAHLSTKCSRWAFVMAHCPSSIVRACVRASVRASTISLNNISSETTWWILTKLHRNDPLVVPYQSCSNRSSWLHK